MADLVERVARALCQEYGDTPDCWDDHLPEAKAAIDIVLEEAAKIAEELYLDHESYGEYRNWRIAQRTGYEIAAKLRAAKGRNGG